MAIAHRYRAFGLELASDIECPELVPGTGEPEVEIRLASGADGEDVPSTAALDVIPGSLRLSIPGVATFRVQNGTTITVAPEAGADAAGVRLFLLGTAVGALLHQRGVLPLHGAALRMNDQCVSIVGASGAGKSSLAAAMRLRGWPMVSDDISAIRLVDGRPVLAPGYPESKVWPDVLTMLGDDPERYERVRPSLEKRRVRVPNFSDDSAPVAAVIVLTWANIEHPSFNRITGGAQMAVLKYHTYRAGLSVPLGAHRDHFDTIASLAAHSSMWHLRRPVTGCPPMELAELFEKQLAEEDSR